MRVVKNTQGDGAEFVAEVNSRGGRCTACSFKTWNSWLNRSGCVKRGARRTISRNMEKAHLEQYKEGTKIFQQLLAMS